MLSNILKILATLVIMLFPLIRCHSNERFLLSPPYINVIQTFNRNHEVRRKITLQNPQGLHQRPAWLIIAVLCENFNDDGISIQFSDAKGIQREDTITGLLSLAIKDNDIIEVFVKGNYPPNILNKVLDYFELVFQDSSFLENVKPSIGEGEKSIEIMDACREHNAIASSN